MRAHFAWWLRECWDYEVDPLNDNRLEYGHLWDWVSYLDDIIEDKELRYEINDAWVWHLEHFTIDYQNAETYWELELIIPCLVKDPMCVIDNMLIETGIYDLVSEPIGIRLDNLLSFN